MSAILVVLNEAAKPTKRRNLHPVKDHEALTQVLVQLGQSRLANNINQLAKLANLGSLPMTPDVEAALIEAVRDIARMRQSIVRALRLEDVP